MEHLFAELKHFVGFSDADGDRLRAMKPLVAPLFQRCIDDFYARVLDQRDARATLHHGESQVGQLKITLRQWMEELFDGPWDTAYLQRRARIGVVHVRIGLAQHYMVTAMNVVRTHLLEGVAGPAHEADRLSLNRVLDLDLAVMLHTYRLDMESKQAKAERLATYGQLVGSIGHELRNPLGVIETSLYVLRSRPAEDPKVTKHLERIGAQVCLANDIITQLLDLIRDRPLAKQRVELNKVLTDARQALKLEQVTIEVPETTLAISGDPTQLRQVFVNLLDNAVQAAAPSGRVSLSIVPRAGAVQVHVDDTGVGIDPAVADRLFEPLVTTKSKGIGLGLALVKRVVERHGGTVEAGQSALGGARFTVTLPEFA